MESNIAKLTGIAADWGTAPDAAGVPTPIVTLHLQGTLDGDAFNLPPLWMTAAHALQLADRLQLAARNAGTPPQGTASH